jgi:hypothetical protein
MRVMVVKRGGVGGEQLFFKASDVGGDLVTPKGSTWRQCPLPRGPWDWHLNGGATSVACFQAARFD